LERIRTAGERRPLGRGVHTCERFIKEKEVGVLRQRAREKHALLLSPRELANLAMREIGHTDAVEAFISLALCLAREPPEKSDFSIEPHLDDIQHRGREVPVDARALRDISDVRAGIPEQLSEYADLTRQTRNNPQRGLQQGGFSSSVRADNCRHAACVEGCIDREDRRFLAVGNRQSLQGEGCVARRMGRTDGVAQFGCDFGLCRA